jgi:hypothetical protein
MNRIKVKSYKDILNEFDIISEVLVKSNSVLVKGLKDSTEIANQYCYSNKTIAKFVSHKVLCFVDIDLRK